MLLRPISVTEEVRGASDGVEGHFYLNDTQETLRALLPEREGTIKCIYMDPPFQTGEKFNMRVRVGAEDWIKSRASLTLETYSDKRPREEYLEMMRDVLTLCRSLLREDGMIFVHVDYRVNAHIRLLMDEIFGEENFLNEIIWAYQTGGRSKHYFSRKHDTIYFYRKGEAYDFNLEDVMEVPTTPRNNHMRRHVDSDGRVYRSIRSNGRVYTYYDDDPVAPSDIWSELNPLQQRDPERTGYDTQKPLSLLMRILRCASREGEWVLDPFAGSGTTLEAARLLKRPFIGIDRCPLTTGILRRRLKGSQLTMVLPEKRSETACEAEVTPGVGFYHIALKAFGESLDHVDSWSVGYVKDGRYSCMSEYARTRQTPEITEELLLPVYEGDLALCVGDVYGQTHFYSIENV